MNLKCKHTVHLNCRTLCTSYSSSSAQPWSAVRAHRTSTCACVQIAVASYYPALSTKGLFSAPFADGCGLDESLAKVLRFVFLTVEDLLARNLQSRLSHSRKSSPPSALPQPFSLTATDHVILLAVSPRQPVIIVRIIASASYMISCSNRCVRYTSHG